MGQPRDFVVDIPHRELERIVRRIKDYEWFEEPVDAGWQYGCNRTYLKELCDYWVEEYDWRAQEKYLNQFPQFLAEVDGADGPIDIHFVHEKGSGNKDPIILLHGWPGSYLEHMEIVEPLAHPERFGGKAEDGRDVIVPSLVGYGFSGPPPKPLGPHGQAPFFNTLMTEVLGYESYIAQGGDWGSAIACWMAHDFGTNTGGCLKALHVNLIVVRPSGDHIDPRGRSIMEPATPEEEAWEQEAAKRFEFENGYFQVQATKPQSLSYGMMDSPVGVAAWLTEKFHGWSDLSGYGAEGGELESIYTKDQLLTNIMLYIVTRRFNTAAWQYYGAAHGNEFVFPPGGRVEIPTGVASYPREIAPVPPRSYCEKAFNVVHYVEQPKGGHFAAFEQPELFRADLEAFLKDWG